MYILLGYHRVRGGIIRLGVMRLPYECCRKLEELILVSVVLSIAPPTSHTLYSAVWSMETLEEKVVAMRELFQMQEEGKSPMV